MIRGVVRRDFSLSPMLFNIFIEMTIQQFELKSKGVKINEEFTDDIAVIEENEHVLNNMLIIDKLINNSKKFN